MIKNALLSVSDKTGIVDFAKGLVELGVTIYSTGGTLKAITDAGIEAKAVESLTGFPEMMDGRVKTLHPKVHGGILAIRDNAEHQKAMADHGIEPIDLVVVNLYAYVGIVVNPNHYDEILTMLKEHGELPKAYRFGLAKEAFAHTAAYDVAIANYMSSVLNEGPTPPEYLSAYEKVTDLRYGENPHQKAAFYKEIGKAHGMGVLKQLHGKELSYNNIVDMEAAWNMVWEFTDPAACIIKHTNPCGAATAATLYDAYVNAYEADSVSAFGGIVALNREVDAATAEEMSKIFLEVIMAPAFTKEALHILEGKKNIRLIELSKPESGQVTVKKVSGGLLVQTEDDIQEDRANYKVATKVQPTEEQWKALEFAWKLVKHVKSNAILISNEKRTLGVGAGQMNRVGSAKIALEQAGEAAKGAVLASDAFFPFGDTVETAAKHGIAAIIQPGGSIRDEESIKAADEAGIAMVFTSIRHFKH